jgi:hypothetical protein
MHMFLFLGMSLSALLVSLLIYSQSRSMQRKPSRSEDLMFVYVFFDLFIALIVMTIISFAVPHAIWTIGHKEIGTVETVRDSKKILLSSKDGQHYYLIRKSVDGRNTYSMTVEKNKIKETNIFDVEKSEVIVRKKEKNPRYELISIYKIQRLKGKGFISSAVNDMYANVYLQRGKAKYDSEKVKIFLPEEIIISE